MLVAACAHVLPVCMCALVKMLNSKIVHVRVGSINLYRSVHVSGHPLMHECGHATTIRHLLATG